MGWFFCTPVGLLASYPSVRTAGIECIENQLFREVDFLAGNGMRAVCVAPGRDRCSHLSEDLRRLLYPLPWDVRIRVARSEKGGSACQIACMRQVRAGWSDKSTREGNQTAISRRVPGHEFRPEAGPLGEAADYDPLRRDACLVQHFHGRLHFVKR